VLSSHSSKWGISIKKKEQVTHPLGWLAFPKPFVVGAS
jgi:hypothetical protein